MGDLFNDWRSMDKRAASGDPVDEPCLSQFKEGLAHGCDRRAVVRRKLMLGRKWLIGGQASIVDQLTEQPGDLMVQRNRREPVNRTEVAQIILRPERRCLR